MVVLTFHLIFEATSLVGHCKLVWSEFMYVFCVRMLQNGQLMDVSEVSLGNERVKGRPAECPDL